MKTTQSHATTPTGTLAHIRPDMTDTGAEDVRYVPVSSEVVPAEARVDARNCIDSPASSETVKGTSGAWYAAPLSAPPSSSYAGTR